MEQFKLMIENIPQQNDWQRIFNAKVSHGLDQQFWVNLHMNMSRLTWLMCHTNKYLCCNVQLTSRDKVKHQHINIYKLKHAKSICSHRSRPDSPESTKLKDVSRSVYTRFTEYLFFIDATTLYHLEHILSTPCVQYLPLKPTKSQACENWPDESLEFLVFQIVKRF